MKISTIHAAFAIGIALAPLSGVAAQDLPVPNAHFQYLDEADFECSKERPLRGMIVSPVVPLEKVGAPWNTSKQYIKVRHGQNLRLVEIPSYSADNQKRVGAKAMDDAAFTIEYSAQVCTGLMGSTVVGGVWSIVGESQQYNFSANGDFSETEIKITLYGLIFKGQVPQHIQASIYLDSVDISAVKKTGFHRRFEDPISGTLSQKIVFQPDKSLTDDNANQPPPSLPIRKE